MIPCPAPLCGRTEPFGARDACPHRSEEMCDCGHPFYRHFDWADEYRMGCKYCSCPRPRKNGVMVELHSREATGLVYQTPEVDVFVNGDKDRGGFELTFTQKFPDGSRIGTRVMQGLYRQQLRELAEALLRRSER